MAQSELESLGDDELIARYRAAEVDAPDLDAIFAEIERRNLDL